jgi:hypothetical protein
LLGVAGSFETDGHWAVVVAPTENSEDKTRHGGADAPRIFFLHPAATQSKDIVCALWHRPWGGTIMQVIAFLV